MKRSGLLCGLLLFAAVGFAQETAKTAPLITKVAEAGPPTLTDAQKLAIRDAQHKVDAIEKQQKDLDIGVQQGLNQASARGQQLERQHDAAKAVLDKTTAEATAGVDPKKWQFDAESLNWAVVPPPTATATPAPNAQPAKPATPPGQQAKK